MFLTKSRTFSFFPLIYISSKVKELTHNNVMPWKVEMATTSGPEMLSSCSSLWSISAFLREYVDLPSGVYRPSLGNIWTFLRDYMDLPQGVYLLVKQCIYLLTIYCLRQCPSLRNIRVSWNREILYSVFMCHKILSPCKVRCAGDSRQ